FFALIASRDDDANGRHLPALFWESLSAERQIPGALAGNEWCEVHVARTLYQNAPVLRCGHFYADFFPRFFSRSFFKRPSSFKNSSFGTVMIFRNALSNRFHGVSPVRSVLVLVSYVHTFVNGLILPKFVK